MRKQFNSNIGKPCLEEQHDTVWKTKKAECIQTHSPR